LFKDFGKELLEKKRKGRQVLRRRKEGQVKEGLRSNWAAVWSADWQFMTVFVCLDINYRGGGAGSFFQNESLLRFVVSNYNLNRAW